MCCTGIIYTHNMYLYLQAKHLHPGIKGALSLKYTASDISKQYEEESELWPVDIMFSDNFCFFNGGCCCSAVVVVVVVRSVAGLFLLSSDIPV